MPGPSRESLLLEPALSDAEKLVQVREVLKDFLQERVDHVAGEARRVSSDLEALWLRLETVGLAATDIGDIPVPQLSEARTELIVAYRLCSLVGAVVGFDLGSLDLGPGPG